MNSELVSTSWLERFKIPEAEKQKWEKDKNSESLLAYGLKHKLVPREEYFDWAREQYQLPFLKTEFFQDHVISQSKWKRIKDLETWSSQRVPVWFWENIVYIGCIEPCEKELQFPHRFVLATDIALKMLWTNLQEGAEITKSFSLKSQSSSAMSFKETKTSSPVKTSRDRLLESFLHNRAQRNLKEFNQDDKNKEADQNRGKVLAMKDYKNQEKTVSIAGQGSDQEIRNTQTGVCKVEETKIYGPLWEKMRNHFSSIIVFKREENILTPLEYMGRIVLKDKNFRVNLEENSLFSILNKNFPYHGPVVDTKINREIFENIGWEILPKHASVISVTSESGKTKVFFGVGSQQVSMSEIGEITDTINNCFKDTEIFSLKKAA